MKRTSLAAMLTLVVAIAATLAVAGCGGKATSPSHSTPTNGGSTSTSPTGAGKQPSRPPAY
jgi:hypothetical protein